MPDQSKRVIGPHIFPLEGGLCVRCGATESGAGLDYRGIRTIDGKTYARYPECRRRWWQRSGRKLRLWRLALRGRLAVRHG